jgi:hypothetical protein
MPNIVLAILTIGFIVAAGPVRAQTYDPNFPVCMHVVPRGGGGYKDCTYFTMAQCQMSASGRAAQCDFNPFFAGRIEPPRGAVRRYPNR